LKALPDIVGCIEKFERPFVAQITLAGVVSILATRSMLIKKLD
jgi:hypothetical protein